MTRKTALSQVLTVLTVICIALGCEKKQDAVFQVGEEILTKGELLEEVAYFDCLREIAAGKNKIRKTPSYYQALTNQAVGRFKVNALIRGDAVLRGMVEPGTGIVARIEAKYARSFGGKSGKYSVFTQKVAKAGCMAAFERNKAADARNDAYFETYHFGTVTCTEEEVQNSLKRYEQYNLRIDATNRLAAVTATNVWKKAAVAKEDFGELANKYSEDPDKKDKGFCGELDEADFVDFSELWPVVSRLASKQVSPLFDTDFGYLIYKLENEPERNSEGRIFSGEFSRIWIRKALKYDIPSADVLRQTILRERRANVINTVVSNLASRAEIRDFRETKGEQK